MFILHCQRPLWDAFDLSWQQTSLYKAPSFKYCHVATCCPCTQSAPPREARPPTRFRASKTAQRNLGFWSFKRKAHAKPAKPAPTTTTSTCAQGPGENKKKTPKTWAWNGSKHLKSLGSAWAFDLIQGWSHQMQGTSETRYVSKCMEFRDVKISILTAMHCNHSEEKFAQCYFN